MKKLLLEKIKEQKTEHENHTKSM